jgi:hypothetical protein
METHSGELITFEASSILTKQITLVEPVHPRELRRTTPHIQAKTAGSIPQLGIRDISRNVL